MRSNKVYRAGFPERPGPLKMPLALGIGTALIYLAFLAPGISNFDGLSMLTVAESLVINHNLTVPADIGVLGRDGNSYSKLYPLLSMLAVPFVAVGVALSHLLGLPSHDLSAIFALVLPALLTAGTTSLVALLALRLGSTTEGAWLAALSFALGTIALVYARTFFAEPLLAFLTAGSLYLVLGGTVREVIGAGVFVGLAVLAKPAGVIVGPILSSYLLAKRRPLRIVAVPVFATSVGLILFAAYNFIRFGSPLSFGQPWLFKIAAIPEGVLGLLLSPGRGLLWYCPAMILSIVGLCAAVRSKPLEALMSLTLFLGYLLLYSFWTIWPGGWSWGPRFLLPALPGLSALTGMLEKKWRKGLLILTVIGFFVNAPTLISFYERYYAEANEQGISQQALLWSPKYAPLIQAWGTAYRQLKDAVESDVRELSHRTHAPDGTVANSRALRVVAVWWWVLPVAGIPRWIGIAVALLLLATGLWMVSKAVAACREEPVHST